MRSSPLIFLQPQFHLISQTISMSAQRNFDGVLLALQKRRLDGDMQAGWVAESTAVDGGWTRLCAATSRMQD